MSDEQLAQLSVDGDSKAFTTLVKRHEQPLAAMIRYLVKDRQEAEDVLQETLLCAWVKLASLQDASRVRGWLLTIARNRCYDLSRSQVRRSVPVEHEELEAFVNRYGRASDAKVPDEGLRLALSRVTDLDRRVVLQFYAEGLTIAEISKREGCPEGTTKRRLHSARNHLRHAMVSDFDRKGQ